MLNITGQSTRAYELWRIGRKLISLPEKEFAVLANNATELNRTVYAVAVKFLSSPETTQQRAHDENWDGQRIEDEITNAVGW